MEKARGHAAFKLNSIGKPSKLNTMHILPILFSFQQIITEMTPGTSPFDVCKLPHPRVNKVQPLLVPTSGEHQVLLRPSIEHQELEKTPQYAPPISHEYELLCHNGCL